MTTPIRPSVLPAWTVGNNAQRTVPTSGEQLAGFSPNQRPDPKIHNWLWGSMSDWLAWLDYITQNTSNFPVSNAGHHVAVATNLQGQLDQLDAALSSMGLLRERPTGAVDGTNNTFFLSQAPINTDSVVAFVDGLEGDTPEYTVQNIGGQWAVVFDASFIPAVGQQPNVVYMTGSSGVGVGGGVGAIENEAGGVGLFDGMDVNVAKLKALQAGVNTTITDNGDGTITISSSGGGGGGGVETHGNAAAPQQVNPSVGITPTTAQEQVWWVKPTTGLLGAQHITATPAIAAGTVVGQKLKLKSVASANYLVIPNLSGTDQNGDCPMGTFGQAIEYTWDGTNWSEDSRRV